MGLLNFGVKSKDYYHTEQKTILWTGEIISPLGGMSKLKYKNDYERIVKESYL